ncbi:MAG TPA: FAD-linked oxidase C-terminal domain-containing protein [Phycisphaerales bacterium]|nr:FAD-linked oxidase C-terminal domain-containing protein [Phycisphaerales bacterium]
MVPHPRSEARVSLPVLGAPPARERSALEVELRASIAGDIRFDQHDRMLYATDASLYQVEPLGVVIPTTVADGAAAVAVCARHGAPVLPRGGGTSLAGQCTARAVVIDLSRSCCAVSEVDAAAGRCRVEPGVAIDDLNATLAPSGWFFAPDPATSRHACIGGCIGNNAAGARSIKYGRTSENVLAIDACLADGSRVRFAPGAGLHDPRARALALAVADVARRHERLIRERFPKTLRRNAGYALDMVLAQLDAGVAPEALDLVPLLCGSEGTLAFTLGAELRLHPLPRARALAVVAFPGVDEAIGAVPAILATGPSAVELLDDMVIGLAGHNNEYSRYVELLPRSGGGPARAVLYVEYSAERDPAELAGAFEELGRIVGPGATATYTEPAAMLQAWKLRKAGEPLLHGIAGRRKPITFVEDNAVPVERLAEFVRRFREIVRRHGTYAAFFAHASVGVLHVRPLIDLHDPADRPLMHAIAAEVADLAKELGGVMSGEHGDGKARSPLLERFYGPELVRAFREVKTLFDARGLFNPGNMVEPLGVDALPRPVQSISERTRLNPRGPEVRVPPVYTYFDYGDQHGFPGAVEMCNGAGVCRKRSGGTMCPSYHATLDERHATRGRGNALRLAITGQLGDGRAPLWNDPETMETLRLCLSCKACKSECPSNVDVARLKAEYLAQSYRERGRAPRRARAFGRVRTLNRLGSLAPGLANAGARSPVGRFVAERLMGVHPERGLPPFARSLARQLGRDVARSPRRLAPARPAVVLFGDCFTMYNEPAIGVAAASLLEAFGYQVALADAGCCGRAMISNGLLAEAGGAIARTTERLMPWVRDERVRAVLVLEPSCLSSIRDDWLQLRSQAPARDVRAVAARAETVEQFLGREWASHPERPRFSPGDAVYHGHCHEKALWGVEPAAALLRRASAGGLRVLDTGCCGMAGSFGYDRDKCDLSMRIGELALFPQVRACPADTAVLAPGTSCRHQLAEGVGRRAVHPVQWLAERLLP